MQEGTRIRFEIKREYRPTERVSFQPDSADQGRELLDVLPQAASPGFLERWSAIREFNLKIAVRQWPAVGHSRHRSSQYSGLYCDGGCHQETWRIHPAGIAKLGRQLRCTDGEWPMVASLHGNVPSLQCVAPSGQHVGVLACRAPQ